MSNKVIIKNGEGAPTSEALGKAELGFDTLNELVYVGRENNSPLCISPEIKVDLDGAAQGDILLTKAEFLKPQSPLQHREGAYFYPLTTIDQVILEDDTRLNAAFENVVFAGEENQEEATATINADTLGGVPAESYATKNFVSTKIAEAQLSGGGSSGEIDLSGYATIDQVDNKIVAHDFASDAHSDIRQLIGINHNESIIGLSVDGQTVTYIKGDGSVHSFTTQDTDTTYSIGTDEVTGLTKLYATTGNAEDGTMTQKAIKTELDKKVGVSIDATQEMLIFT